MTKEEALAKVEELKGLIEQVVARLNYLVGQRDAYQQIAVGDPPKE